MSVYFVETTKLQAARERIGKLASRIMSIKQGYTGIKNSLDWDVRGEQSLDKKLSGLLYEMDTVSENLLKLGSCLGLIEGEYLSCRNEAARSVDELPDEVLNAAGTPGVYPGKGTPAETDDDGKAETAPRETGSPAAEKPKEGKLPAGDGNQPKANGAVTLDAAKNIALNVIKRFEGGGPCGDKDGAGMSLGFLQWNFGTGNLQPMLLDMANGTTTAGSGKDFDKIFDFNVSVVENNKTVVKKGYDVLRDILGSSKEDQMEWCRSISTYDRSNKLKAPWQEAFDKLLDNGSFTEIENNAAQSYVKKAETIMKTDLGMETVMGYTLALDIAVNNGSIKKASKDLVTEALNGTQNQLTDPDHKDYDTTGLASDSDEYKRRASNKKVVQDLLDHTEGVTDPALRKCYFLAAAAALQKKGGFSFDSWSRKVAIIEGHGVVHGEETSKLLKDVTDSPVTDEPPENKTPEGNTPEDKTPEGNTPGSNTPGCEPSEGNTPEENVPKTTDAKEGLTYNSDYNVTSESASKPVTPRIINDGKRSSGNYDAVIDQFDVSDNPRYKRRNIDSDPDMETFCNIFVWDVTSAMGAEVPHWIKNGTNEPYTYDTTLKYVENAAVAHEVSANGIADWLKNTGAQYGWKQVSGEDAQEAANLGKPVVGAWHNGDGSGHVVIVRPDMKDDGEIHIAQAGRYNYDNGILSESANDNFKKGVKFYVHD